MKDEPKDLKAFSIWMKNIHTDEVENDVIKDLNDQLYEVLVTKGKGDITKMARNFFESKQVNGAAMWWRMKDEAVGKMGIQMQSLAGQIYKPDRMKKYSEVTVALDQFELAVKLYKEKLGAISDDTLMYGIRQLVPEELENDIIKNIHTCHDNFNLVRDYVL